MRLIRSPNHVDPKGALPSNLDGGEDKETANSWRSPGLFLAERIVMGFAGLVDERCSLRSITW
jgi:hypothetical protein